MSRDRGLSGIRLPSSVWHGMQHSASGDILVGEVVNITLDVAFGRLECAHG
jgi:hypothetical protein